MTKSIRVTDNNSAAIEAQLLAANGTRHTYEIRNYDDVRRACSDANEAMRNEGIVRFADYVGAVVKKTKTYKRTDQNWGVEITLVRRTSGWFLTDVRRVIVKQRVEDGYTRLHLTLAQADIAVRHNAARYTVQSI